MECANSSEGLLAVETAIASCRGLAEELFTFFGVEDFQGLPVTLCAVVLIDSSGRLQRRRLSGLQDSPDGQSQLNR